MKIEFHYDNYNNQHHFHIYQRRMTQFLPLLMFALGAKLIQEGVDIRKIYIELNKPLNTELLAIYQDECIKDVVDDMVKMIIHKVKFGN